MLALQKWKRLVLEFPRVSMDGQVLDAELAMEFDAQVLQQVGLRDAARVDDVGGEGFEARRDSQTCRSCTSRHPPVVRMACSDRREVDVRGRPLNTTRSRLADQMPRTPMIRHGRSSRDDRVGPLPTVEAHQRPATIAPTEPSARHITCSHAPRTFKSGRDSRAAARAHQVIKSPPAATQSISPSRPRQRMWKRQ